MHTDFTFAYRFGSLRAGYRFYRSGEGMMPKRAVPKRFSGRDDGFEFTHQLEGGTEFLDALLSRYDNGTWENNQDPNINQHWAVGELLCREHLLVYQVPAPRIMLQLRRYTAFPKDERTQWRLLPCNAFSGPPRPVRTFANAEEALAFLQQLPFTAAHHEALADLMVPVSPPKVSLERLAHCLAKNDPFRPDNLMIIEEPLKHSSSGRPRPAQSASNAGADGVPPAPNLGPHDEPGYEPDETPPASLTGPAQSLAECEQRLDASRERLKTQGYQPKYTDDELQALAEKGELDDRFVVRLIPSHHAQPEGYLGRPEADGSVKYWSTTFSQLENADTDPKTICGVLGMEYQPGDQYTLAIVDTQAKGAGQATTLVPTYEKLGEFASREDDDLDPEVVKRVMTPEYSEEYVAHKQDFLENGGDINKEKRVNDYAEGTFSEKSAREAFKTRMTIDRKLGANEHFTGDGTTKNLLPNGRERGVMETFTYDKKPNTLGNLEQSGSAALIETKPL